VVTEYNAFVYPYASPCSHSLPRRFIISSVNFDFSEVVTRGRVFREEMRLRKRQLGDVGFDWYPYDTLSSLTHLDRLLTGPNRLLFGEKRLRILDVGCQDGDFSFFLERLGHDVVALDHRLYNHNGMQGVRALRGALGSGIQLHEIDVDQQFSLPHDTYDLVLLLGVLYHLRNPFYALEELARRGSHCLLSTRIARRLPGGAEMPPGVALAYLLGDRELNNDETNYFIFSEPALKTMLQRTHWELCDYLTVGEREISEPARLDLDERAFCLVKSRYDGLTNVELLEGWHGAEGTGWRWTKRKFEALIRSSSSTPPKCLTARLFVAEGILQKTNPLQLSLTINGRPTETRQYRSAGHQTLFQKLWSNLGAEILLQFELNEALAPDGHDERERGIVVESIRVE
jgi:tRNA (mo5U34)-methyltransferase